ncbi:MAG: alpha-amylase family glycosyl hydrolase [Kofleriaceae bacterium]|nr:alpha-amylase family glycosyl hydrolase [Kofleriaceae bacterium]
MFIRRAAVLGALVLAGCPSSDDPDLTEPCTEGEECPQACASPVLVGELSMCSATEVDAYKVTVAYVGDGELSLEASEVTVNGEPVELATAYDPATKTFTLEAAGLAPSKYSALFRLRTKAGEDLRPLFVPMWIGEGMRYADFTWHDAAIYQIFTDRFLDGDPRNNIDNSVGDLARVDDERSRWQGGDFAGITQKIRDGYFEAMGINALWISSPLINSHNSQPSVGLTDQRRFSSYHSYHPISTGYTHHEDLGLATPIEPAFGTPEELHELVREAHARGIRVIPDFVANHVHRESPLFQQHPEWFFPYNPCDGRWDEARIGCWFTSDMPDFDYGANPAAVKAVVDHALWLVQEFNFDGFRADALKHMDDKLVFALKKAVVSEIETTVKDHALTVEPTVFYMVGESLGGWARYHVREDMVQGQVDEEYYNKTKAALLTFSASMRDLAGFAVWNDTAYLTPQDTMGGRGGFPGAIMGNFFGNHDQVRALTEAFSSGGGYERLRLAQTFLFTSPRNIPMLYQGDDIGTEGGQDPDNRKMQKFAGLSAEEQTSLANARKVGKLREEHVALRRGVRSTVLLEDWFWVYKLTYEDDEAYVAINRDNTKSWTPPAGFVDGLGVCSNGTVPVLSACIFVRP